MFWRFALKFYIICCRCFEPFHWSFTSSRQCFKTLCWCFRFLTSYPFGFVKLFVEAPRSLVVLLGLLKLSIEVPWGFWLSWTRCIKAFTIVFVCYFSIFFTFLFYKLCLFDPSSWTFIILKKFIIQGLMMWLSTNLKAWFCQKKCYKKLKQ